MDEHFQGIKARNYTFNALKIKLADVDLSMSTINKY
jgi:hypothetical protein